MLANGGGDRWSGTQGMLDRKRHANDAGRKNQGSCVLSVRGLLVRTQGHQARRRSCASVDNSLILFHQVPGNAYVSEPDQRMKACGHHRGAAVLLLVDECPLDQHQLSEVVCSLCASPSAKRVRSWHWCLQDTSARTLVDHQCVAAQSYNFASLDPETSPPLELVEEDCHWLDGTTLQCC